MSRKKAPEVGRMSRRERQIMFIISTRGGATSQEL